MLIVDGVEYRSCTPSSEAELEELVEAHSKRIFGEDSLYFPVKTRLRSLGGVGSIPDGYVLGLSFEPTNIELLTSIKFYMWYHMFHLQTSFMPSKYEKCIYQILSDEPVTPNEIALKLGMSHNSALKTLMHIALTKGDVRYKNSRRIHLFWKVRSNDN